MTRSTPARRTAARRALAVAALATVCALPACSTGDTDEAAAAAPPSSPQAGSPVPEGTPAPVTGAPSAPEETAQPTDEPAPEEAAADEEPAASDPPRPGTADVVLSSAYWDPAETALLAAGYVGSLVEEGGTCTLEVSREGSVVRATAEGVADATTTVCSGLALPGDELGPGTWSVVLRYESGGASGESAPLEVEVPE